MTAPDFWPGPQGDEYFQRNKGNQVPANVAFLNRALVKARCIPRNIESILEFGAGTGELLRAAAHLFPFAHLRGVEVNEGAHKELVKVAPDSLHFNFLDVQTPQPVDLVMTKGLLIHMRLNQLERAYEKIYRYSKRWILLAEYYNPDPVQVPWRGDSILKADFGGDMLDHYAPLKLVDYGFIYHRDQYWPQDDLTWWLLEKR